jgi:hypothetical protein
LGAVFKCARVYAASMEVSGTGFGVACAVFAIILVITVATDVVMRTDIHPRTRFRATVATTLFAGLSAGILIEYMGLHILGN